MSTPEILLEKDNVEMFDKLPLRVRIIFAAMAISERIEAQRRKLHNLKEGRSYSRKAENVTEAEPAQKGHLLLKAGRAYLGTGRTDSAIAKLEAAEPYVKMHKSQGSLSGYSNLATLYQSLGFAYKLAGDQGRADEMRSQSIGLADEIELQFGLRTEFLPDGGQLISPIEKA